MDKIIREYAQANYEVGYWEGISKAQVSHDKEAYASKVSARIREKQTRLKVVKMMKEVGED